MQQLQTGDSWQGEVTNHDNIFQPVYHMLLGLHTGAFCCLSVSGLLPFGLALLQKAAEGLSRVALHPVLTAMLASTMALCEALRSAESHEVSLARHQHKQDHQYVDDKSACAMHLANHMHTLLVFLSVFFSSLFSHSLAHFLLGTLSTLHLCPVLGPIGDTPLHQPGLYCPR